MVTERGTLEEFIEDVTPFFYGKRLTYIDVGAFKGVVYEALLKSKLSIREAHLFEANPKTYNNLKELFDSDKAKNVHLHNMALSNKVASLQFRDNGSMTKVIPEEDVKTNDTFIIESTTLDNFSKTLTEEHISILKVDVEGHEKEVFAGAENILVNQQVDLIYVEAGMNRDNKQQSYYRDIDDILAFHGYKIFRIYEQMFEWMEDSPFLRRVNIAYMSEKFAKGNLFRLSNEIFSLSTKNKNLKIALENTENKAHILIQDIQVSKKEESEKLHEELVKLIEEKKNQEIIINSLQDERDSTVQARDKTLDLIKKELEEAHKIKKETLIKLDSIKSHLSYRLGQIIVKDTKSATGVIKLPFTLYKAYREYKEYQKKKENESIFLDTSITNKKSVSHNTNSSIFPQPMKSAIIWQANEMMQKGYRNEGVEFACKNAKSIDKYAVELLKANRDIKDEQIWLKRVNSYLQQFSISPIKLKIEGISRFHRITASCDYCINEGPMVSIIMPAFNAEQYIEHSVNSILNQTWNRIELIIVDDCSSDNTWGIMQKLARKDNRIKILQNKVNVGPYVSKNYALDISKGEFVTGHDADDWAHPQRIEKQVQYMIQNTQVQVTLARMIRMEKTGKIVSISKIGKTSDDGALRLASISTMFRREALRNILGYWDSARFGADSELIARSEKIFGDNFVVLRQLSMICLDAEGSLTNHPEHGVSKTTGISPSRKYYREQWKEWHKQLSEDNCYLPFPHEVRLFDVSEAGFIPIKNMMANKKKIKIEDLEVHTLDNLDDISKLSKDSITRFNYLTKNFSYEYLWQPKKDAKYLFILLHGAKDRGKNNPPYFDRWSWADLFPGSVLNVSDPSLLLNDKLGLAWFVGNKFEYPILAITDMVKVIAKDNNIDENHIIFWGSSGGAFSSLAASNLINNSKAVAINPQTNVLKYYKNHVTEMLNTCLDGISEENAQIEYANRLDMVSMYKKERNNNVLIVQNTLDEFHYLNHYLPFVKACDVSNKGNILDDKVRVMLYSSESRHGPETKNMVNEIFLTLIG